MSWGNAPMYSSLKTGAADPKTASYPGGFQKEALAPETTIGAGIGGLINFLRNRSIMRGMTTGGLTGAGISLGGGLGHVAENELTGNVSGLGAWGGGAAGGAGGYMLAQKLHDAISEDKEEDRMNEMLAQYKQGAAMYPTLTKQAFEIPKAISDTWKNVQDSLTPDQMNALVGGGVGALGGGLLGYLKPTGKGGSSAGNVFGHALLGAGAGAGLGYNAANIGNAVVGSDWWKNQRARLGNVARREIKDELKNQVEKAKADFESRTSIPITPRGRDAFWSGMNPFGETFQNYWFG